MRLGAIFGLAIVVVTIIVWLVFAFSNSKITKRLFSIFLIGACGGILIFSYFFEAYRFLRLDLQAHYQLLDRMVVGGWSYAVNKSMYSDLFVYNTFAYLISLTKNYALLQTIPLLIDFLVFSYIYFDVIKRQQGNDARIDAKHAFFVFFLWITTFGLKLALVGIRCVLAIALCALAIYNEYILGKKKIMSIILYVAASFIHYFALMAILLRLFSLIKRKEMLVVIFLAVAAILRPILVSLNESMDNSYFNYMIARVVETLPSFSLSQIGETSGGAIQIVYIAFIVIDIYLIYISRYTLKNTRGLLSDQTTEVSYGRKLCSFCYTVGLMGLCMAVNYVFMERYMYIVAWALLMLGGYYSKAALKNRHQNYALITFLMIFVLLFVFFFNDIYLLIVHYVGDYFLAI